MCTDHGSVVHASSTCPVVLRSVDNYKPGGPCSQASQSFLAQAGGYIKGTFEYSSLTVKKKRKRTQSARPARSHKLTLWATKRERADAEDRRPHAQTGSSSFHGTAPAAPHTCR
eukprot:958740-Prymnesium_polylepis.1